MDIEWIAITFALVSLVFSIYTFRKQITLNKSRYGFDTRQKIDQLMSADFKLEKEKIVEEYFKLKDNNEPIIFTKPEMKDIIYRHEYTLNMICSWYEEENWVDKKNLRKVHGGFIVNSWNLLKDHIMAKRKISNNCEISQHFENVSMLFEKEYNIHAPVYKGLGIN